MRVPGADSPGYWFGRLAGSTLTERSVCQIGKCPFSRQQWKCARASARAFTLAAIVLLTGCATKLPAVLEIPVPVECKVEMPAEPAWATDLLAPNAGIWDQVKALLAEREQAHGFIAELEAAVSSCQ